MLFRSDLARRFDAARGEEGDDAPQRRALGEVHGSLRARYAERAATLLDEERVVVLARAARDRTGIQPPQDPGSSPVVTADPTISVTTA